jgi:hypothetical protein
MLRMVQVNNLYDGASRRRKLVIRFSILCLVAFFIAQVVPTLAEEQSRSVEAQAEVAPSDSGTANVFPDSSTSGTVLESSTSEMSQSPSPSPSPKFTPAMATPGQGMQIEIPVSVSVDPRARVGRVPKISVTGPEYLLACLTSSSSVIDIVSKGFPDDQPAQNLLLRGDLTSSVVVAGSTGFVVSALNAAGGIRVSGLGRELAGTSITISLISTDKMASGFELCGEVAPANKRTIRFSAIGLGLGLKKGEIRLN